MSRLADITIIIPSYNRQNYVLRQLAFWSQHQVVCHVLDGSNKPIAEHFLQDFNNNVHYHHLDISLEDRFGYAIKLIQTDYSCLLSDDEFFLPSSLESCIREIETHDLIACKGRAIGFNFNEKSKKVYGFLAYPQFYNYTIDHCSSEERLNSHMSNYVMACLWSITRSDIMKLCLKIFKDSGQFSTCTAAEIGQSLTTAYLGKFKIINELMWLRSAENESVWWSFGELSFFKWYTSEETYPEKIHFIDTLSENIADFSKDDNKEIRLALTDALDKYISAIKNNQMSSFIYALRQIRKNVSLITPVQIKDCLKSLIYPKHERKSLMTCALELKDNENVSFDKNELAYINQLVADFHNAPL